MPGYAIDPPQEPQPQVFEYGTPKSVGSQPRSTPQVTIDKEELVHFWPQATPSTPEKIKRAVAFAATSFASAATTFFKPLFGGSEIDRTPPPPCCD